MAVLTSSCSRLVGDIITCSICQISMIKYGKDSKGKQRYYCRKCKTTKVEFYTYKAYKQEINENIIALTKEGVGIRGTARLSGISPNTVLRRIILIASKIAPPAISMHKTYEVDEMRTYVKNKSKLVWIVYALEKETRKVMSFNVGARTNNTLSRVIETITLSNPKRIYTDKLKNYQSLIDKQVHNFKNRATNHIERMNLTLRTHLKRLSRRTLCFSRSVVMLSAVLRIYFWA